MRGKLNASGLSDLVEFFDNVHCNTNATVAENLLFRTPVNASFGLARIAENAYVRAILAKTGLNKAFVRIGRDLAGIMIDPFADLPPDHEFVSQYSFISSDELSEPLMHVAPVAHDVAPDVDYSRHAKRYMYVSPEPRA